MTAPCGYEPESEVTIIREPFPQYRVHPVAEVVNHPRPPTKSRTTGTYANGATAAIVTPTIAAGKGWGHFDFQTTFGVALSTDHLDKLGTPLAHNVAFQYRVLGKLWPEVEVNSTYWMNGSQHGKKQVFLSTGLIAGKFHLWKRLGVPVGGGVQIPATHFHTVDHSCFASVRFQILTFE